MQRQMLIILGLFTMLVESENSEEKTKDKRMVLNEGGVSFPFCWWLQKGEELKAHPTQSSSGLIT